jgi:hypothetical protein
LPTLAQHHTDCCCAFDASTIGKFEHNGILHTDSMGHSYILNSTTASA